MTHDNDDSQLTIPPYWKRSTFGIVTGSYPLSEGCQMRIQHLASAFFGCFLPQQATEDDVRS